MDHFTNKETISSLFHIVKIAIFISIENLSAFFRNQIHFATLWIDSLTKMESYLAIKIRLQWLKKYKKINNCFSSIQYTSALIVQNVKTNFDL